jgi:ribonuclease HI
LKIIEVYIDGSAHPNPGPGGYGVVAIENDKIIEFV